MLGRRRETTTRFISVEPNRKIEFEAMLGPIEPKATARSRSDTNRTGEIPVNVATPGCYGS